MNLLCFAGFAAISFYGWKEWKENPMKLINMIAGILTAGFVLWDFVMLGNPGAVSFDEVGYFFVAFGILQIGHCGMGFRKMSDAAKA